MADGGGGFGVRSDDNVPLAMPRASESYAKADREGEMLYECAKAGDVAKVCELIGKGVKWYAWRSPGLSTSLHRAADGGHSQVIAVLLKAGADVNVLNKAGNTPLHNVAGWGKR